MHTSEGIPDNTRRARRLGFALAMVIALVASLMAAPASGADEHESSGVIAGVITNSVGEPIPGVSVTALFQVGEGVLVAGSTTTGEDGSYVIGGLGDGSFVIEFFAPEPHVSEFYDDAEDFDTATPVMVVDGEATIGVDAELAGGVLPSLDVNFQAKNAVVPEGWSADSGRAFAEDRGFGWVGVGGNPALSRQCGDREAIDDQVLDTFCHAQTRYERIAGIWNVIAAPAVWEVSVPNGLYDVEVTMGESVHASRSVHNTIDVEGVRAIDDFVANRLERQRTAVVTVEVADGRLTLDPRNGVKGRIASVRFAESGRLGVPAPQPVLVSFQPKSADVPFGFVADNGEAFSSDRGFGWRSPLGGIATSRQCGDRNVHSFQGFDTFCHAQARYVLVGGKWTAMEDVVVWELAVPNGTYDVTLTMGEAQHSSSNVENTADVEGVRAIDAFIATPDERLRSVTLTVTITDGFLTVDPTSGSRGKIAAVVVAPQDAPASAS